MRLAIGAWVFGAAVATACSYTSFTPPARMMPLETAVAPAAGHGDLQLEGSLTGAVFGFGTANGGLRLRESVNENLAISVDGGVLHVRGNAADPIDQDAFTGRLGVHVHMTDRDEGPHLAMTAGVGSGYSPLAGRWLTEDVGIVASGNGRWAALFVAVEGFASQPIDDPMFEYVDAGDQSTHDDRLTRTFGARITFGLELRDGRGADSRVSGLLGFMYGGIEKDAPIDPKAPDDGSSPFLGLGAGLRVAL